MHGGGMADDEPMAEMNLIPLIDIALTLVIILMVTTTFVKNPGVSLQLPHTVTREGAPETPKDLTVVVLANGGTFVDGVPITAPQLQGRLNALARRDRNARVLIKGDESAAFRYIMTVMDMGRQAGLTRIILPSLPIAPGTAPASLPAGTVPPSPAGTSALGSGPGAGSPDGSGSGTAPTAAGTNAGTAPTGGATNPARP